MPTIEDLKALQSQPLLRKISITQARILEWYLKHKGQVYVSFSGGKDSTVLLHIARQMFPDIEAVFVDTGLEYPEIRGFVKQFDNTRIIHPKMSFLEVLKAYGYPVISKEVSERVDNARKCISAGGGSMYNITSNSQANFPTRARQILGIGGFFSKRYDFSQWKDLLTVDFKISNLCCKEMKKKPLYGIKKKAIVATTTEESFLRRSAWLKTGCNAFKAGVSKPMSFWTEQDILAYIKRYDVPIASVYGNVVYRGRDGFLYDNCIGGDGTLCTTGCRRTGCEFCAFGAHRNGDDRFLRLKQTHPRQYDFCIGGGTRNADGLWEPTKEGLGMWYVFDTLNRLYGKNFIRY